MYKKTKLTEEQMNEIRKNLKIKGVALKRLNPKGMSQEEFIGSFDGLSHEWIEGIFTREFRRFSLINNDKKKWILLDGPIDFNWVENFNSILDDNRKISIPNGESIKMSDGMALLFETDNLKNVTPATVSRCGLIFMHREDTMLPKSIFNQWLRNLPPNLMEYQREIEVTTNYFMSVALEIFEEEKKNRKVSFKSIDTHWIMQNFVRFLTTMVFDYYMDFEKNQMNAQMQSNPNELGKSLQNLDLHESWADAEPDPNLQVYPNTEDGQESRVASSSQSRRTASRQKVRTPDAFERELGKSKRLPRCNFIDSEDRYENALKFTPLWLEAFIIFSLIWTFHPALSHEGRQRLDQSFQERYELARSDFGVYQREKKRKLKERNKARQVELQKQMKSNKKNALFSSNQNVSMKDVLLNEFNQKKAEKPLLISNFPEGVSFYDYYFNLDSSEWEKFNVESAISEAVLSYDQIIPSQRKAENIFIPSYDTIRYSHVLECMITKQNSTMVIGPYCSGRSALLKQVLFYEVFNYTRQLMTEHITLSKHSDSIMLKENVETMLEYKTDKETGVRALRPHSGNKLIVYIQDLHLGSTDSYGDQSAIESIRDYLTAKCWLSPRKNKLRDVENLSFFCCMSSNTPETEIISRRSLHKFNMISLEEFKTESQRELYQALTDFTTSQWPSAVHLYSKSIVDALMDITGKIFKKLKPTPMKVHYTFNWRDLGKILFSMSMVEGNFLRKPENVMSLFYHECLRTFGDRLLMQHDKQWFLQNLESVCREHFHIAEDNNKELLELKNNLSAFDFDKILLERKTFFWPIKNPDDHFFSLWNQEVEGYYIQVGDINKIQGIIEGAIERYNGQNDRGKLGLLLYDSLNRFMIKILRVINAPNGNLITICMKGYGISAAIKLVTYAAGQQLRAVETYEGFSDDEWKSELRRAIMYCGAEDKPLTFFIDEYKLLKDQWYTDLECVLKNNMSSELTRKSEIQKTLLNIHREVEKEKKGMKLGLSTAELKRGYLAQKDAAFDESDDKKVQRMLQGSKQLLHRFPHIQAELYNVFINRIKSNFHLVLLYSPTGTDFRQKLSKHKEIMYLSQMIFMKDLPLCELEQLGRSYLVHQEHIASEKALINDSSKKVNHDTRSDKQKRDDEHATVKSVSKIYISAIEHAIQYTLEENSTIYFTPGHFLTIFKVHQKLIRERFAIMKGISSRYEAGLERLKEAQAAIYNYHKNLESRSPVLQEKLSALIRIIGDIEDEFNRIKAQRDQLKRDQYEAETSTDAAMKIRDQCQDTLDKIVPALSEAMNSVQALEKRDIAELKSMKKPPKVVKLIMQIVCLLLGVAPAEKKSKKTGKIKFSYWKAAQGPEVLGNPNLSKILMEFDKNKVTPQIMMDIEEVLNHPDYSYERAFTASGAATGIFKWASATRDYFYIFKEIEPRRDAFLLSQKQYMEKKDLLKDRTSQIKKLDSALKGLKEHQQSKDEIIEDLRLEIHDCNLRKKRADSLLRGLQAEKQKWLVCMRMLRDKYSFVIGDVLLTAVYITLLSGFTQKFRGKCIQKAMRIMSEDGIKTSSEFKFSELFGDAILIRKWHNNYLPTDEMSINNALVLEKTKKFCLLIDPQLQGIVWLRAQCEEAGNTIRMVHDDPKLQERIGTFIEVGKVTIIEQVQNHINQTLLSIMKQQKSKHAGQTHINFCRKQYKYDKNFRLYVVSAHPRPEFSSHVTNHITLINFAIDMESLMAQMLSLVIKNERSDLENASVENHKEAIECIKSLKDTEQNILQQLNKDVETLLGDEQLITTLDESKHTAEFVAQKLQEIQVTHRMIKKSKEMYSPIAYRAANLYFLIANLQKINILYQFSLNWFKDLFKRSLELTNVVRSTNPAEQAQNEDMGTNMINVKNQNFAFSREKRVELLTKTFTHELYKRVSSSIFYKDKTLVQYYISIQVLRQEKCIKQDLFEFLTNGADVLPGEFGIELNDYPKQTNWLTGNMWIDLVCLSKLAPFNEKNLLDHIQENPQIWTKYYYIPSPTVRDLPNKVKLDCNFFIYENDEQMRKQQKEDERQKRLKDRERLDLETKDHEAKEFQQSMQEMTENEILNDQDIWEVISSSEDEKPKDEAQDVIEEPKTVEQDMAKYLIGENSVADDIHREMNIGNVFQQNSAEIRKREKAIKSLCELCILRCLRPEQLLQGMQRYMKIVLDPSYQDFREDILKPMIIEQGFNPDNVLGRINPVVVQQETQEKKKAGLHARKKPQVMKSSQNMLIHKKLKEQEAKETTEDFNTNDQLKTLVAQAYQDSDCLRPILFITTRQIDIFEVVSEFHKKSNQSGHLYRLALMKGVEDNANEMLEKGIQSGDWVLLENLQMVESWLFYFNELVSNWKPHNDHNKRFRVFITCIPMPNFPLNLARQSIKIVIEPPQTIKQEIFSLVSVQEQQSFFKKSGRFANFHKNLFFSLAYFHSIIRGRTNYGNLGWNYEYQFDFSDFEVSNAQLSEQIKTCNTSTIGGTDPIDAALQTLEYLFANINYAGKIQRVEDQMTLNAIMSDLINKDFAIIDELEPNMDRSHFGYPSEDCPDFYMFVKVNIPDDDPYQIFGFDENQQFKIQIDEANSLFEALINLNREEITSSMEEGHSNPNIEINAARTRIRSGDILGERIQEMIDNEEGILGIFIQMQTLLNFSSLDTTVIQIGKRYDQRVDDPTLIMRDANDFGVVELGKQLIEHIRTQYPFEQVLEKFPVRYKQPLNNVVHKELLAYKNLLDKICNSVIDLIEDMAGKYPRPIQIEKLWRHIQLNRIPQDWLLYSFQTGHISMANYLIELQMKLDFWNKLVEYDSLLDVPVFWLPAFYNPSAFLHALAQTRSRLEEIPITDFQTVYEVQTQMEMDEPSDDSYSMYLNGFWLQGADWDIEHQYITEVTRQVRFVQFPVVKMTVKIKSELSHHQQSQVSMESIEQLANQSPNSPNSSRMKRAPEIKMVKIEQEEEDGTIREVEVQKVKTHYYNCPVFHTINRLSSKMAADNTPVERIQFKTYDDPTKWIKRAVALILEPSYD